MKLTERGRVRVQLELGPSDLELVDALVGIKSRARGARVKFLAKLGLQAERGGIDARPGMGKPAASRKVAVGMGRPAVSPEPSRTLPSATSTLQDASGVGDNLDALLEGFGLDLLEEEDSTSAK